LFTCFWVKKIEIKPTSSKALATVQIKKKKGEGRYIKYLEIRLDSNNNPILYVNISNLLVVCIHDSSSLDQQLR
jgi:hypothetical protein